MKLYHSDNIDEVKWSSGKDAQDCKRIWSSIIKNGARHYIHNVDCDVFLLSDGELFLPVVVPDSNYKNSYVCSPYGQYIDYGYREVDIELGNNLIASKISKGAIKVFEKYAPRHSFDQVIFVNNWLVSTNLYPFIEKKKLKEITDLLVSKYPKRAIVFRSLSTALNKDLIEKMLPLGYEQVLSRQIYIVDPKKGIYRKKKAFKEDLRLQRNRSEYQWVEADQCSPDVWKTIKGFYDNLYLKKYSLINPQFSNAFFRDSIQNKWLRYHFLQKEGKIYACIGYLYRNGIMTTPIIGYDFDLPQKEGLYRLTSLQITQEGVQNDLIVHSSSGASKFKKVRGGEAHLEYNLVYNKHLSRGRKFPWQTLQTMTKHIALPILNRYEL
jgi:hypothetical protein